MLMLVVAASVVDPRSRRIPNRPVMPFPGAGVGVAAAAHRTREGWKLVLRGLMAAD